MMGLVSGSLGGGDAINIKNTECQIDTLFVLGAGSSFDFGLPIGSKLRDTLISDASKLTMELERLIPHSSTKAIEYAKYKGEEFSQALQDSASPTIDAFLRHRRDMADLGKRLIARILLEKEGMAIKHTNHRWAWLAGLFHSSISRVEDFNEPGLKFGFLSFNYDRIARFGINKMAESLFKDPSTDIHRVIDQIPFTHIYGSLVADYAKIPRDHYDEIYKYYNSVNYSAESIRVISEERLSDPTSHIRKIQQQVKHASKLVFLGFGFDDDNLRLLGIDPTTSNDHLKADQVLSTNVKLGKATRDRVSSMFSASHTFDEATELDCETLVSEFLTHQDLLTL